MILQEDCIAKRESSLCGWSAKDLLSTESLVNKWAYAYRSVGRINNHEGRATLQMSKRQSDSVAIVTSGVSAPFADDEIEISCALLVAGSPFNEVGGDCCVAFVDVAPDSFRHVPATDAWSKSPLVVGIDR